MLKNLNYNPSPRNYIIRKITSIAIRTTYTFSAVKIKIGTILVRCYVKFLVVVVVVVVFVCFQVATCRLSYKARLQLYFNALSKFFIIIINIVITFIADVINNGQVLIYCSFNTSFVVSVCLFYCCYIRFLLLYLVVSVKFKQS